MPIKINGSTSGSVTLAAPATGSDVTLTLPTTGFGKIVQVVRATDTTNRTTTSSTFADVTGMSVTITPQLSNGSILVIATFLGQAKCTTSGYSAAVQFQLANSSNTALSGAETTELSATLTTSGNTVVSPLTLMAWVSPGSTAAATYKLRYSAISTGREASVLNASQTGQIFAIEVGP